MAQVLVVHDDQALLDTLSIALEAAGYQVSTSSGPQALRTAIAVAPDAILLDLDPPNALGLEAATALRADAVTAPIPLLALAGRYNEAMAGVGISAEAWIPKPFDLAQLHRIVARWAAPRDGT